MIRACIIALCLALGACTGDDAANSAAGQPRPGEGHWVVINYWAIWCKPCRDEIPELNEFAAHHGERVRVYAVNFDDVRGDTLLQQAAELGIEFTLLEEDPAAALGYDRPTVLPTTVMFDPSGELAARLLGPQSQAALEAWMGDK